AGTTRIKGPSRNARRLMGDWLMSFRGDRGHTDMTIATDHAAFTELLQRHRRELHVHCYRMLGSFDDCEDLVQETFLRAWRGRATFAGRSSLRAWLYKIAT